MSGSTQHRISASERGSALLVAMCFAIVLGFALGGYQAMCYYTLKTGSGNVQSIRSRQLAEAGMEEALWALNNNVWTGWTLAGGNATKSLTGFSYESASVTGQINLTITGYGATKPIITAVGITQNAKGTIVRRTLTASTGYSSTATTGKAPLLTNALAATGTSGTVNFISTAIVDSYDSSVGLYNSSTNSGYSAIVSGSSVTMVNGVQIKGYVTTPPTSSGVVALSVGSTSKLTGPTTASTVKIDTTRQSTSPYQNVFDVPTPSGAGTTLAEPVGTVNLGTAGGSVTTYYAALGGTSGWSGYYYLNSGTLQIDGPVILVVPGYIYINGGGIVIKPGGSLQLLVAGGAYLYYNAIDNQTKLPKNLSIVGTSTSTGYGIYIYSSPKFYGSVYAPKADVTLYGYSSTSEYFGSFVGNSITVYPLSSPSLPIHYDMDLRNTVLTGVTTPYAVSNATETFP